MNLSKRARILIAVALVAAVVLAGAAALLSTAKDPGSDKLRVVTTFYPLYYFSSEIGGDLADVSMLIPDNSEPHSWEPTASDMVAVGKADIMVYNGAGFEPWLGTVMGAVDTSDMVVVDSSKNLQLMLSGEVEKMYELASEALNGSVASTVAASASPAEAPVVDAPGYVDVSLSGGQGGSGYLKVVSAQGGDLRFFVTNATNLTISSSDGTEIEYGLESGEVPSYPMFSAAKFVELEAGAEYTVKLSSSSDRTDLVMVAAEHEEGEHEHGLNDPHFWLDPLSAKVQVRNILDGFIAADPEHSDEYRANAGNLTERLDALDQAYVDGLAGRTKNAIITTHEAFNYMAARYGFEAYAATGISADSQPSAQDMAALVEMVHDHGLEHVFSDPTYSDTEMQTIASETGTTVLVLDAAAGRSGIHAGMDYFEIMYANLEQLRIGMGAA